MPSALLALVLLAATIDPRLAEPLRLLAEVGARESIDDEPGQFYADLPESLGLTLAVGELPNGAGGRYDPNTRTVAVTEAVLGEDPRVVAVILAHELQHAVDQQRVALGLLEADCLALEVRGFQAQARVTRLFWPDELPGRTRPEQNIAAMVRVAEEDGSAGIAARIAGDALHRESCAA